MPMMITIQDDDDHGSWWCWWWWILTWDTWAFQCQNLPQWPTQSARWYPDKYCLSINFTIIHYVLNTNIWLTPCGTSLRGWRAWRQPPGCSRRSRRLPPPAPTACLVSEAFWGKISETRNFYLWTGPSRSKLVGCPTRLLLFGFSWWSFAYFTPIWWRFACFITHRISVVIIYIKSGRSNNREI